MGTREDRERAEYERLHRKYGTGKAPRTGRTGRAAPAAPAAPKRRRAAEDDGDHPLLVLTGSRADTFISRMFGDAPELGDQDDDDQDDEDQDDEDQDDEDQDDDEPDPDPEPGPRHRFFSGSRRG